MDSGGAAAELLAGQLDRGEAEAIVLADESKADWLLMDRETGVCRLGVWVCV